MFFTRLLPIAVAVVAVTGLAAPAAVAAEGRNAPLSLFGDATRLPGGAVQLRSAAGGYGGVDFKLSKPVAFGDIAVLRTTFDPTDDTCGAGSPRFQLNIDTDGNGTGDANVFVYPGTLPSFTCATPGDTGNLVGSTEPRFDATQLGAPVGTYAQAAAVVGTRPVTGIQLVVDAGYTQPDGEQTVIVNPTVRVKG